MAPVVRLNRARLGSDGCAPHSGNSGRELNRIVSSRIGGTSGSGGCTMRWHQWQVEYPMLRKIGRSPARPTEPPPSFRVLEGRHEEVQCPMYDYEKKTDQKKSCECIKRNFENYRGSFNCTIVYDQLLIRKV